MEQRDPGTDAGLRSLAPHVPGRPDISVGQQGTSRASVPPAGSANHGAPAAQRGSRPRWAPSWELRHWPRRPRSHSVTHSKSAPFPHRAWNAPLGQCLLPPPPPPFPGPSIPGGQPLALLSAAPCPSRYGKRCPRQGGLLGAGGGTRAPKGHFCCLGQPIPPPSFTRHPRPPEGEATGG